MIWCWIERFGCGMKQRKWLHGEMMNNSQKKKISHLARFTLSPCVDPPELVDNRISVSPSVTMNHEEQSPNNQTRTRSGVVRSLLASFFSSASSSLGFASKVPVPSGEVTIVHARPRRDRSSPSFPNDHPFFVQSSTTCGRVCVVCCFRRCAFVSG